MLVMVGRDGGAAGGGVFAGGVGNQAFKPYWTGERSGCFGETEIVRVGGRKGDGLVV